MHFKTLLAILQSEEDAARVLDCAVALASHHQSHLIGLHAEAMPIAFVSPLGQAVDISEASEAAVEGRQAEMRALFTRRAEAEGISHEWRGMENVSGDTALSALDSARCANLVIAPQRDPDGSSRAFADVEALLFQTGRPVLFVPYAARQSGPVFRKAIVAWNGSREAARAAFDALPFLIEAESVEVLAVDAESDNKQDAIVAGAEIASALARHGVEVSYRNEASGKVPHGEIIENRVFDTGAELLVMGAYGHSRLKEFFFGGVTRTILQSMSVPVLMSR